MPEPIAPSWLCGVPSGSLSLRLDRSVASPGMVPWASRTIFAGAAGASASASTSAMFFFFQAEDGIRDGHVTGVQTCALPILWKRPCRVYRSGGYIAAASRAIGHRAAMHRQAHLAAPERCALSRFGAYVLDKTCREHLARRTFARILGVAVLRTAFSRPCVQFYIRPFLSFHFRPKTAAPFPQRWGLPRKGRAVFRREDRGYEERR